MVYDYYKQNDVPFTSQAKSLGIRKNYPHKNPIKTYNTIIIKIKIIKKFLFFYSSKMISIFYLFYLQNKTLFATFKVFAKVFLVSL